MKFSKQKKVAAVFLAFCLFFLAAQETKAATAAVTYKCDCFVKSAPTINSGNDNLDPGDKVIGYFADRNSCNKACVNGGFKSYMFIESTGDFPNIRHNVDALAAQAGDFSMTGDTVPGESDNLPSIIKCGRAGQPLCHLCDLIAGFNNVIQYLMKIAIGVALLAMAIGGILYTVSAGESGLMEMAKNAIKNAAIGFVLIFAAYLIVNSTIQYLGAQTDANGNPTLGIKITSWGQFDCTAANR